MSYAAENANNFNLEADRKSRRSFLKAAVHRIKKILSRVKPKLAVAKPHLPTLEEIQNDINEALESAAKSADPVYTRYVFVAPDMDLRVVQQLSLRQSATSQAV